MALEHPSHITSPWVGPAATCLCNMTANTIVLYEIRWPDGSLFGSNNKHTIASAIYSSSCFSAPFQRYRFSLCIGEDQAVSLGAVTLLIARSDSRLPSRNPHPLLPRTRCCHTATRVYYYTDFEIPLDLIEHVYYPATIGSTL